MSARVVCGALLALVAVSGCGRRIDDPDNNAPIAVAGDDVTVFVGASLEVDGGASIDDDGEIVSFAWDFGDGGVAEGAVAAHSWSSPGGFVVTLTVTDDDGAVGVDTRVVTVTAPAPTASFTFAPATPGLGENVIFDAGTSTASPGSTLVSASWAFGDGGTSTSTPVASHAFATPGTFSVTLTVTDDTGASDSVTQGVIVSAASVAGTWDLAPVTFACSQYTATFPDTVLVVAQSGTDLSAQGGNGRVWTGSIDGADVTLSTTTTVSAGSCGSPQVTITWRPTLGPDTLVGRATAFFDLSVPCNCSAVWDVSATRRQE